MLQPREPQKRLLGHGYNWSSRILRGILCPLRLTACQLRRIISSFIFVFKRNIRWGLLSAFCWLWSPSPAWRVELMTTPHERLNRMRKSFAKNKSVLTEDYKYFTTPDTPTRPRASIPQNKVARKSAEQSAPKSPKRNWRNSRYYGANAIMFRYGRAKGEGW
jgi:hypothetical protein